MSQKNLITLIAIVILVIIIAALGIYYLASSPQSAYTPVTLKQNAPGKIVVVPPTPAQQADQVKKDYPEVITGTINFLDTGSSLKTTVKTDDGKVYILSPGQPESIYKSFGAKDGGRVQIQGKVLQNGELAWGSMKSI